MVSVMFVKVGFALNVQLPEMVFVSGSGPGSGSVSFSVALICIIAVFVDACVFVIVTVNFVSFVFSIVQFNPL